MTLPAALLAAFAAGFAPAAAPQSPGPESPTSAYGDELTAAMQWRCVGPSRGGRSAAVAGVRGQRETYYFGSAGGGVWKTTDAGVRWSNVSDGFFGGSIGAVAVAESDPNVVYVGGGEKTVRGNVSHGDGIWKSTDAGKTWKHVGLPQSRHVPRIRVHPRDPDVAYAAVLGHLFGPNPERGVYRTRDGGASWERILHVNDDAGAVDLVFDPGNPRILYASLWRVRRTPYSLESGGEGSGLWKSTDGGDSWQELSRNKGLPKGALGIIGIAVSPARTARVWAIVENDDGGVFRSEDGGATWSKVNSDRSLRQRAWYYTRIYADPRDADTVHVCNVQFWRSKDGGKSFESIRVPHGDNHDLWIDPDDPLRMIEANDGGANVSFDGGESWSRQDNQPTAQFYRVTTDDRFPYRIYGAQQDNSTVRIAHRSDGFMIGERDWEPTAGGESGWLAPDPRSNEVVYGGSYGGHLERVDHRTGENRTIDVWPDNPMGHGAADLRYRFQWNFPIFFSPHDPGVLYGAGNVLFRTTDEGESWLPISPDLTRDDKATMGPSGGPITKDNTGVEYYGTIFAALESPHAAGVLWCGSDDGLLHLTRDGGASWENVTPRDLPEWSLINSIEAHPFEPAGLYVAATRYKSDDFRPLLFKTVDWGKTWTKITDGIGAEHFTRVIRADPARRGLLYAGTERGLYLSFDDGASWKRFQLDLPITPITDLAIKNGDLIAATQGRSFWVLDDLSPLHGMVPAVAAKPLHVYPPRPALRIGRGGGFGGDRTPPVGANPPSGAVIWFHLASDPPEEVAIEIRAADGAVVRTFSTKAKESEDKLEVKKGQNRFVWDLRHPGAKEFEGMVMWAGSTRGPRAVPGDYEVAVRAGDAHARVPLRVVADPRSSSSSEDLAAQLGFLVEVRDKLTETHAAIVEIRDARGQLDALRKRLDGEDPHGLVPAAEALGKRMTSIEEALYQTKNRSSQDPLNFPIRLNNRLSALGGVVAAGDYRPSAQAIAVKTMLVELIDEQLAAWRTIRDGDVPAFNAKAREAGVPAVFAPAREAGGGGK
jgi:photosystem II stability/assembly factor-like uncharacterized protein